jgi:hypothetical protein
MGDKEIDWMIVSVVIIRPADIKLEKAAESQRFAKRLKKA